MNIRYHFEMCVFIKNDGNVCKIEMTKMFVFLNLPVN